MIGAPHYRNKDGHFIFIMRNGLGNTTLLMRRGGDTEQSRSACSNNDEDDVNENNGDANGANNSGASSSSNSSGGNSGLSAEEATAYTVASKEALYASVDAASRAEGRLVQLISAADFRHGTMATMGSADFRGAMDAATALYETYYPMLVGPTIVFNMHWAQRALMRMILYVMPWVGEKMLICGGTKPADILAFAERHLGLAATEVPTFLGGKCACPGGCVLGVPNEASRMPTEAELLAAAVPSWADYMGRLADKSLQQ